MQLFEVFVGAVHEEVRTVHGIAERGQVMSVKVYPRFAVITRDGEDALTEVCDNCKKEYKREMLCEVKDYFQRVEPGGVVPSGECPACGALCYPIETVPKDVREWFQQAAWVYPVDDKKFVELLSEKLRAHFGEGCGIWQNENVGNAKYPQLLCSADLHGIGGDVVHLWRDGQTWWPMSGDYSLEDEEMVEAILRQTILEFKEKR
jgi:hypothetical protein